ncbi:MAG: crossover junction endodeoxyribonuclease RuvC [Candidatus Vogelbacteria bacterium]|nr:crossover junction endodeoxyribonuclease RuvC [Candidatus Vogelbacteria bacterium]
MRVLAIDPGFERLGIALIDQENGKEKLVFSDCWQTSAKLPFEERLRQLGEKLDQSLKKHQPDIFALEKLFFTTNQKTASKVSEVRGMLIYVAAARRVSITEFTPLQVKSAICGYGKATKNQVMTMVPKLIKLEKRPKHDDEFDAIAIGLTALAQTKFSLKQKAGAPDGHQQGSGL